MACQGPLVNGVFVNVVFVDEDLGGVAEGSASLAHFAGLDHTPAIGLGLGRSVRSARVGPIRGGLGRVDLSGPDFVADQTPPPEQGSRLEAQVAVGVDV